MLPRKFPLPLPFPIYPNPSHLFNQLFTDQGQGGAQSIEDGAALGILFSHLPFPAPDTPEQIASVIETRLVAFEEIRRGRASLMQIYSSAGQDQAQEQVEKRTVLAKAFLNGGKVPSEFSFSLLFGFPSFWESCFIS